MKVLSIVGARPQFVKAAPMMHALANHTSVLVHTGQHYDSNMSDVFFRELNIPAPDVHLGVGSGGHGAQTGAILSRLEPVLLESAPDWVVVFGDTNSTLAGALAASKLHLRIAHVEAGLRSFNRTMPEEINRIVADHVSDLLLCPGETAVANLAAEGITRGVHCVGDVMVDALHQAASRVAGRSGVLDALGLTSKSFVLATVHRAENTDDPARLREIVAALDAIGEPVVFPVHPRTAKMLQTAALTPAGHVRMIEPLGYLDMIQVEQAARLILTDSGGVQKEAYWLGVPCVTLRQETEWPETVRAGWNTLAGADRAAIARAVASSGMPHHRPPIYGDGHTAPRIVQLLEAAS
jgi:UDP-GlcNAc3NAcA epimerase